MTGINASMPSNFSTLQQAATAAAEDQAEIFTSLTGSSNALLFMILPFPSLLLCSTEAEANTFYTDAVFWSKFLKTERPILIPPSGDSKRLKSLSGLYALNPDKIITTVDSSLLPIWNRDAFPVQNISKKMSVNRADFTRNMYNQGYHNVPVVTGEGEISVRGGIIDIFSPDSENPARIEFFGDDIESIRYFDITTQLSINEIDSVLISPAMEPDDGPNLMDLLAERKIVLNEPDDIKRLRPDFARTYNELKLLYFTSLPLENEGFNCSIKSASGFGLLRNERQSIEGFAVEVKKLKSNFNIMMICISKGQAKRLQDLFDDQDIHVPVLNGDDTSEHSYKAFIKLGELSKGFSYLDSIVLSDRDIFGQRPAYKAIRKSKVSKLISSIEDFKEGDYIVHIDHGIGKFLGIKKETIEGNESDFIAIEYMGGDKLFVPLERINYVQRFNAPENVRPKIDKLGGKTWQRTKKRVKQKIKDMAEKLIKIYAKRTTSSGNAFSDDTELHREFDGFFPYEETPDQLSSIDEIRRDMEQTIPMDRLLCGDVGYGKTEVIMRACFKAVYDSMQVAVLVPTTILAEQHFETFTARFSAFPVKVDFLSRFKNRAEQKQTMNALAEGQIDIIIGTHSLLSKGLKFSNLGLLVIDEEHKFGVTHKEKIKALKSNVDVITLSATPIPRTLHMALSGIRGMSTIETPPEDRLAVTSSVVRFNPSLIREAIEKELSRNGQVFFVHNRIHDIHQIAGFIGDLVPAGRIGIAHGQMKAKELEQVMRAFFHGKINVLVSTAIIGSGLDIPSANTIFIDRADRFGLADLYQLRGRVGRSDIKAYAYFLIPGKDVITDEARKKLQAIQELGYLGAGFRLALKDLEIRGAGNLLGAEQSGHIEAVGFDMYMKMLETAVAELKGEKILTTIEPELDLQVNALIPDDYIEDPELRMSIYRKISMAKNTKALEHILDELKDRFGPPNEKTENLLKIMELKLIAMKLFISKIQNMAGKIKVLFAPDTPVTPENIFSLYESRKKYLRFLPEGGIELDLRGKNWRNIFRELKELMEELVDTDIKSAG